MFDKKSDYALNASLRPGNGTPGREDSAGDNDTFSRPTTDLKGNPAAHVTNDAVEL